MPMYCSIPTTNRTKKKIKIKSYFISDVRVCVPHTTVFRFSFFILRSPFTTYILLRSNQSAFRRILRFEFNWNHLRSIYNPSNYFHLFHYYPLIICSIHTYLCVCVCECVSVAAAVVAGIVVAVVSFQITPL